MKSIKIRLLSRSLSIAFISASIVACGGGGGDKGTSNTDVELSVELENFYNERYRAEQLRGNLAIDPITQDINYSRKYVFTRDELDRKFSNTITNQISGALPDGIKPGQFGWPFLYLILKYGLANPFVNNFPVNEALPLVEGLENFFASELQSRCGVEIYDYEFHTVDAKGLGVISSASLSIPFGDPWNCSSARPVVINNHGKFSNKTFRSSSVTTEDEGVTQIDAMTNSLQNILYAGAGYIMVSPDYVGIGSSADRPQAFLHKVQKGKEVYDALRSAKALVEIINRNSRRDHIIELSGQLLIGGFSEGGYVTTAGLRTLEKENIDVLAAAPGGNPAAIMWMFDMLGQNAGSNGLLRFLPDMLNSWHAQNPRLFSLSLTESRGEHAQPARMLSVAASEAFPDASTVVTSFFPINTVYQHARAQGEHALYRDVRGPLPLFNSEAAETLINDINGNPCPASLYSDDGAGSLPGVQFYANYAAPLSCNSAIPFRKTAQDNDLRDYVPRTPMFMCGSAIDDAVYYEMTQALAGYYLANGYPEDQLKVFDFHSPADTYGITGLDQLADLYRRTNDLVRIAKTKFTVPTGVDHIVAGMYCMIAYRLYYEHVLNQ